MESQNGWGVIDSSQLDKSPIPGTDIVPVPGVQAGDVATVLLHVGKLFNDRVAKVYNPGCWGWNPPTKIPGSNIISNHSSGTAIDLNAPSFPWQNYTMTNAQREACRGIVRELENVVAWGGDFPTIVDEMHFEIDATEEDVARVANNIRQGDEDMQPAPYETANIYAQTLLMRDMSREEWEKYHQGKTRNQLFDEFRTSQERADKLKGISDMAAALKTMSGLSNSELKKKVDTAQQYVQQADQAIEAAKATLKN